MTPQQKAVELIEMFLPLVESFSEQQQLENAKKCALITSIQVYRYCEEHKDEFWEQVREEIRNHDTTTN